MARARARRLAIRFALVCAAAAWAGYWGERFFEARGRAETAMDKLQPLLARGFPDAALAAEVDAALADSHRALAFALGVPLLVLILLGAGLWLALVRRER